MPVTPKGDTASIGGSLEMLLQELRPSQHVLMAFLPEDAKCECGLRERVKFAALSLIKQVERPSLLERDGIKRLKESFRAHVHHVN